MHIRIPVSLVLSVTLLLSALGGKVRPILASTVGDIVEDGPPLVLDSPEDGQPAGIARLTAGGFVVASSVDGALWAQQFSAARVPVGPRALLAQGAVCGFEEVVGDAIEGFWATWCELHPFAQAVLQKFSPDGRPLSRKIYLARPTPVTAASLAHLAPRPGGGVIAAWTYLLSLRTFMIQSKGFGPQGAPLTETSTLSTLQLPLQHDSDVSSSPDGRAVAVWSAARFDGDRFSFPVRFRLLDPDGAPLGLPADVNQSPTDPLAFPKVASLGGTGFLVAWTADTARYRAFDWSGRPLGPEQQLGTIDSRVVAAESAEGDGAVVLWRQDFSLLSATRIERFGPTHSGVIATSNGNQSSSTELVGGRMVLSWREQVADVDSLRARGYKLPAVFADGFESGDLSAWSQSVP